MITRVTSQDAEASPSEADALPDAEVPPQDAEVASSDVEASQDAEDSFPDSVVKPEDFASELAKHGGCLFETICALGMSGQEAVLTAQLNAGVPLTYRGRRGHLVQENPDGSFIILKEA